MIELLSIAYRTASREEIWSGNHNHLTDDRIGEMKQRHAHVPRKPSAIQKLLGKAFGTAT